MRILLVIVISFQFFTANCISQRVVDLSDGSLRIEDVSPDSRLVLAVGHFQQERYSIVAFDPRSRIVQYEVKSEKIPYEGLFISDSAILIRTDDGLQEYHLYGPSHSSIPIDTLHGEFFKLGRNHDQLYFLQPHSSLNKFDICRENLSTGKIDRKTVLNDFIQLTDYVVISSDTILLNLQEKVVMEFFSSKQSIILTDHKSRALKSDGGRMAISRDRKLILYLDSKGLMCVYNRENRKERIIESLRGFFNPILAPDDSYLIMTDMSNRDSNKIFWQPAFWDE